MKKIALEEHFTRPGFSEYAYGPHASLTPEFIGVFEERLMEFDSMRLAAMDKAGIELAVLSITSPGVQAEADANTAIRPAREANDFLTSVIQKHPTRYAGFAHLPMQDAKAAADELARCVTQLGFKGAMINGHTKGHYLDEPMYYPFWERVQELDLPIYLHPRDSHDLPVARATPKIRPSDRIRKNSLSFLVNKTMRPPSVAHISLDQVGRYSVYRAPSPRRKNAILTKPMVVTVD